MRVAGDGGAGRGGESRGVLECARASGVGGAAAACAGAGHTHRPLALYPHCKQTYSHLTALHSATTFYNFSLCEVLWRQQVLLVSILTFHYFNHCNGR